jgi:drug/metabolite transporter (DMT)-like permease
MVGAEVEQARARLQLSYAKRGLATALVSGILWGLDGVLLGLAVARTPFISGRHLFTGPLVGSALHDGLAGVYLLAYNLATGRWRELGRSLATRPGQLVCLAALFGGPLAMSGYLLGISFAGAAYAMGISALYPVVGALMAQLVLKERITARAWLGIIACVAGAILIGYVRPEGSHPHFYLGIGLALLSAVGWGIEGVISTFGMDMVDPAVAINLRESASCAIFLVALLPLVGGWAVLARVPANAPVVGILAAAALVGAASYLLWYLAFSMCGVARTMSLNITYALGGLLLSWAIGEVRLSANLALGALVVTVGAALVVANPRELVRLRGRQ